KIEYSENFSKSMCETFDEIFKDFLNSEVSNRDIEKKINKIYNLKYADELYYTVKNNTLYINGETGHLNTIGVGLSYRSNYGSTINLGTDMYFNGKFGNIINFNLKFGDYLGLDLGTYSYYGRSNKVGVFTRFGYNESPYYFYKDYKKVAKFLSKELFLNFGIFTQPNTKTMLSYGISSKIVNFDTDTGSIEAKEFEYSGNINKTYLRFKYDTLDSLTVPMQGLKADLIYNFSNSFGNLNTSVYGPSYYLKGYKSLGKNSSLLYGLSTAVIRGENIKADQYIKLGGVYNNIESNEFEFYGFNFHEKSIKEFLSMSIGLRYKLFYSTYLTAKFNMTTFGNEGNLTSEKLKMLKNFSKGMGLSLIYDSPIGPVEFTVSDTFKKRKPIATFSIGYKLD
ncbi:MAG: BamA/TamA family outer membrane protein, partial [Fusobacterium sp.]|nr:BamA/TamA family outer membrane protein [Fusobacterium sp.]